MYLELPSIITVRVVFKNNFLVKDYTGKLVKSILIAGNPRLEELFGRSRGVLPKPIHITPLYQIQQGESTGRNRKRTVYTRFVVKDSVAKPPTINRLKPVEIRAGEEYYFYIAAPMNILNDVLLALSSTGELYFGRETIVIDTLHYEINYVDIEKETIITRKTLENNHTDYLKVTFMSPTLLKDPLVVMRKKKKKLLLPLPDAIFSTPFLMTLIDMGRLRKSIFLRCMRYIKSVFDIPYTALKTVNLVWYVYDNEVLPALIGYVKYFIDREVLAYVQRALETRYKLDFIGVLSKSIVLAKIYGVGDGRATGFGHINIRFPAGWGSDDGESGNHETWRKTYKHTP